MSDADFETIKKLQQERNAAAAAKKGSRTLDASSQRADTKQKLTDSADNELYERDGGDKFAGYHTSLPMGDDDDEMEEADSTRRLVGQYTASRDMIDEFARGGGVEEDDVLAGRGEKSGRIADRETDYQKRRFDRVLTPTRADPFAENRQAGSNGNGASYREIMEARDLEREEERVRRAIENKEKGREDVDDARPTLQDGNKENAEAGSTEAVAAGRKRKKRWDVSSAPADEAAKPEADGVKTKRSRWDQTPSISGAEGTTKKRSRWDQAPSATPMGNQGLATPAPQAQAVPVPQAFGTDISGRNMPLSDEELDMLLPGEKEGYKILEPPPGYAPVSAPAHKLMATPAPQTGWEASPCRRRFRVSVTCNSSSRRIWLTSASSRITRTRTRSPSMR